MPLIEIGLGVAFGLSLLFGATDNAVAVKQADRQLKKLKKANKGKEDMLLEQVTFLLPASQVEAIVACPNGCGKNLEEGTRLADTTKDQMVLRGQGVICNHGTLHPVT